MTQTPQTSVLDERFVLPDDVLFVPVEELVDSVRAELQGEAGDHAVTRPGFRVPTRLVDADTADLLRAFRPARNIVDAILHFANGRELDPQDTLEQAFPVLQLFTRSNILVPESSADADALSPSAAPGQRVAGWDIEAVIQCTLDTEVYRARGRDGRTVALKIVRKDAPSYAFEALSREARILRRLDGAIGPTLVGEGCVDGRPWLAVRWINGVPVSVRANEIRRGAASGWRRRLLRLAVRVVDAGARIHEFGVAHGDIHPRNLLVDRDDNVTPIDFGAARVPAGSPGLDHDSRAATGWYLDPETASPLAAGRLPGPVTDRGEQYSLAAVAYELICGQPHLEVAYEVAAMNQQICQAPTQPFTQRGFEPWPEVEFVLDRALHKDPARRFSDVRSLARSLAACSPPSRDRLQRQDETLAALANRPFLRGPAAALDPIRDVFDDGPICGVDHGAAGLAWYFWRLSILREEPRLLGLADIWARRAEVEMTAYDAWHEPTECDDGFAIDGCSVLHRAPGVAFVRALIAFSRDERNDAVDQLKRFAHLGRPTRGVADLTLGAAGVVACGCTLVEAAGGPNAAPEPLLALLTQQVAALTELVQTASGTGLQPRQPLSLAHGWVGPTFALLRARQVIGLGDDTLLRHRLDALAAAIVSVPPPMPGWCNGPAGQIPVLLEGYRQSGRARWREAAEQAGRYLADHDDRHGHLCCGLSGRIFALLSLYQHTGATEWRDRARVLARQLATARWPSEGRSRPHSLFWGSLGAALALEELKRPERACMPVFGSPLL